MEIGFYRSVQNHLLVAIAVLFAIQHALATEADRSSIETNEQYIEDVLSPAVLPLDNPRAMFAAIFATLRERVKVFPTENYYYFSFFRNGVHYAGNIRLAAKDRDAGKLHFAYFEDYAKWRGEPRVTYVVFDTSDGVTVERAAPLAYRVSFQDKTVLFELNDLSNSKPAASSIAPDEKYIGPIFDESAIRFFLVFNTKLKLFHYILDETVKPADELATQITKSGGFEARPSLTGEFLYFSKTADNRSGLWTVPLEGGPETQVPGLSNPTNDRPINYRQWDVSSIWIFFVLKGETVIQLYDIRTQRVTPVWTLIKPLTLFNRNLAVSPNGRWVTWAQVDIDNKDIEVIDQFR